MNAKESKMEISVPTLLLDKEKCLANIQMMAEKARQSGVRLRPHFKTHQSAQVGEWFKEFGIDAITVSSLRMAHYFANNGWNDITVAFPVNLREIDLINKLAAEINLNIVVVNLESVQALQQKLTSPVNIWLKIDAGYRRTGALANDHATIERTLDEVDKNNYLKFQGFLAHDGHTYKQTDAEAIHTIHNTTVYLLNVLRNKFKEKYPYLQLSIGDTPSCSIVAQFAGVDEIRPGNFVFYDLTQQHIGSCGYEQIAVCMACPVVATHPDRNEIILYGGSVHFSKDALLQENGDVIFGLVVELTDNCWSAPLAGLELVSLSQEHGTVRATPAQFKKYKVGDIMGILPVHSCLTADSMKGYKMLNGEKLEHLSGIPQYVASY